MRFCRILVSPCEFTTVVAASSWHRWSRLVVAIGGCATFVAVVCVASRPNLARWAVAAGLGRQASEDSAVVDAKIDAFGPRATVDRNELRRVYEERLQELGDVTFDRIGVAPFAVRRFGTTFGLVLREPEQEDDAWAVEVQPGNGMAFFEPW